jgi:hypothetical protein
MGRASQQRHGPGYDPGEGDAPGVVAFSNVDAVPDGAGSASLVFEHMFVYSMGVGTWEAGDPAYSRPVAAPLERCAELLGVDLATVRQLAATVEPYLRADGDRIWSLMQLERQLRPEAYGRCRGGYLDRR